MAPAAAAAALLLLCGAAAAPAPAPLGELPDGLAELVTRAQARSDAERSLNACFSDAYGAMATGGCRALDEGGKRHLAVYFTNCHLEFSGRQTFPCTRDLDLKECTSSMDAVAFSEYGAFTRHVDLLCFSIESKVWRQETAGLIDQLASGAADSALMLDRVVKTSEDLHAQHALALLEAEHARNLSASLIVDVSNVQAGLADYRASVERTIAQTQSSYSSVADVLGRLAAYQQILLSVQGTLYSNLLYVQSGAFYASAGVLVWALTASPRTSVARPWLYLALIACLAAEFWVIRHWSVIAQASSSFGGPGAFTVPPFLGSGSSYGGGALPPGSSSAQHASSGGGGGGGSGGLPSPPPGAAGSGGATWLDALRMYSLGALSRGLTWLGSESKRSLLDPMLLSLSWDAASLEAWDSAAACWGVRLVYCAYALALVLYSALSYTDYSRASFHLLGKLQAEVDRMAAVQRAQRQAEEEEEEEEEEAGEEQEEEVVLTTTRRAASPLRGGGGGAVGFDEAGGDPDWDAADPDDLGATGNVFAAMAQAAGAPLGAGRAPPLLLGGGAHHNRQPYTGAGTGLVLAPPAAATAFGSLAVFLGGSRSSSGGSGSSGALSTTGSAAAAAGGHYHHAPHCYPLRACAGAGYGGPNPLVAFESPAAFERVVHLTWLASVAARVEEEEESDEGEEADDVDMGSGEEDEGADGEGDDDGCGVVTSSWGTSDDEEDGGGLDVSMALMDGSADEGAEEDEARGGGGAGAVGSGAGAQPLPLPSPSPTRTTTSTGAARRASTTGRRKAALLSAAAGSEPLDDEPVTASGRKAGAKRGRAADAPSGGELDAAAPPAAKVARGAAAGKRLSLAAGGEGASS